MLRKQLGEILTPNVINVSPTTSVSEAIRTMRSNNIICIVVLEENEPIKDWSTGRDGGPGKIVREDARI